MPTQQTRPCVRLSIEREKHNHALVVSIYGELWFLTSIDTQTGDSWIPSLDELDNPDRSEFHYTQDYYFENYKKNIEEQLQARNEQTGD